MASLKEVKNRINSVKNTRKITSAMKMVASAKLHKAQGNIESMLPYQRNLLSSDLAIVSPYTILRDVRRIAVVVFSSNTSLCGAFNANVIRLLNQTIDEYRNTLGNNNILLFPIGRKVEEAVKKMGFETQLTLQSLSDKPSYKEATILANRLMAMYISGEIDRVELIYHHFKSMATQTLLRETYLPIDLEKTLVKGQVEESAVQADYIVEPSAQQLISDLIPLVLKQKIFTVSMDSNASEHAARTLAMQVATDNANELIQDLTKQYNKGRQQAITNELLDIVGGSMR